MISASLVAGRLAKEPLKAADGANKDRPQGIDRRSRVGCQSSLALSMGFLLPRRLPTGSPDKA